ncbi:LuxR C-terminal-related transcriptional regulator [Actinoplanes sp. OR16]|uniref:AAA family ATPase n=1 Tax=Actinoplanes sp. OR16 TaxID=946334 RepID=UPI00135F1C4B|nr:LuxR C-terminal-related transcriptional regulator [Actinoplanes sp. OR16]
MTDIGQMIPAPRAAGRALEPVPSKLLRPATRPGTVARVPLIERLAHDDAGPVVSVVAPAGYGKTTLLAQWAERNGRAFAWVSADEGDNDPRVLLSYIAEALDAVEPIGERVFAALASPQSSVAGSVIPRLAAAFRSMSAPVVLVLDDVHVLRKGECRAAVSALADHVPAGSRLVLAGRSGMPVRVARLRAEGRLLEVGPDDLALTTEEASALLHRAGVRLGGDAFARLFRRTEGWAAGLYLAALSVRAGVPVEKAADAFSGSDRFVSEYLRSELLERLSDDQRRFLTRTAVLERMTERLCDSVLGATGSGAVLEELAAANMLLVPLDRSGRWFRYHHLFRDMLLAELDRREPDRIPELRRRAADWHAGNGSPEDALEYALAAGDADRAARLVEGLWNRVLAPSREATLRRWIHWLDQQGTRFPEFRGRAWAALFRAELCRNGIGQMRADADEAALLFAGTDGFVVPVSATLQGIARVLSGDGEAGDAYLRDAVAAGGTGSGPHHAIALAERSLLAMARGDHAAAEDLAGRARAALDQAGLDRAGLDRAGLDGSGLEESIAAPLVHAVQARTALHRGDLPAAREHVAAAQRVRPWLSTTVPFIAVQARIELARVHLALADVPAARILMDEIDEVFKLRPDLGTLAAEAESLRARLSTRRGGAEHGPSRLTVAELRLLPLLATHLMVPEIADEVHLSPHTIRAQVQSIYRKLGTTSRSKAVARARELGLLDS